MRKAIRSSIGIFRECFRPHGPVVEIGSCYAPGYQWLADLRPLFPGMDYVGCDARPGPGVDRIEDVYALTFANGYAGTVLLCEVLEHLRDPKAALAEVHRVLRDDGLLVVTVPFQLGLHAFPTDFWRFTSSGLHLLLDAFPARTVFALGPRVKPAVIFAVACKTSSPDFERHAADFERKITAEFEASRLRGLLSELRHRGRDFLGCLLGRAHLEAAFFRPDGESGFRPHR
jgi:SAM-dependent methyltransferase